MLSSKDTKTMSEAHNDKPSHNIRSDPGFEQGSSVPKPSSGTASGSPDMTQTPPTAPRTTDGIVPFYVSIVKSIMDHRGIFDDEFLRTIQEQLEEAKSRLGCAWDRYKDSSPTMHAKRQELIIGAEKYFELLGLTNSILGVSFRMRDLDA
ncbi:hypothetical protein OCU04_012342 [Sclerotinia nivalis]|uniref:Uncharacterized protein n=1 Tax=Sclerotinia nivalis TaxID=352851 RepID=A0A9X0AAX4_9HELO|nr:hypothetical protein OCU04_012342 [Sclerotinia nivalis]